MSGKPLQFKIATATTDNNNSNNINNNNNVKKYKVIGSTWRDANTIVIERFERKLVEGKNQ